MPRIKMKSEPPQNFRSSFSIFRLQKYSDSPKNEIFSKNSFARHSSPIKHPVHSTIRTKNPATQSWKKTEPLQNKETLPAASKAPLFVTIFSTSYKSAYSHVLPYRYSTLHTACVVSSSIHARRM